jgi:phage gp36-like protein
VSYATLDLLTARYSERMLLDLTDRTPKNGAIDTAVVDRALADTDAVIDGFVAGKYGLPLAMVPPLLVDLALAIAIYKLHPAAPPQKIRDDYTDALKSLDKIASGTIKLPIAGIEPPSSGASGVVTTDRERPFTPENLRGFI